MGGYGPVGFLGIPEWGLGSGGGEGSASPDPRPPWYPISHLQPLQGEMGVTAPWGPLPEPRALPRGGFKERHCSSRGVSGSMGIVMARDRTPAGRLLPS